MILDEIPQSASIAHPAILEAVAAIQTLVNRGLGEFPIIAAAPTDTPDAAVQIRIQVSTIGTYYIWVWMRSTAGGTGVWRGVQLTVTP